MRPDSNKMLSTLLLLCILILVCGVWLMASVPPVSRDALTHHLAVPKLWIENGSIIEIPSIPFSYYPMNLDLLFLIPLYFGNDIIPKYIHFSFGIFTAILIFFYVKKRIDSTYGLLGALSFLSIPIIVKLSISVYVDLGLIFFSTASLLCLLKWMDSGWQTRFLFVSAFCCGLALGTKYNGLIPFFLLSCIVPFAYLRKNSDDVRKNALASQIRAMGYGLLFVIVSLSVFSPWMIKNYMLTANPVYPLYNSWLNPKENPVNDHIALNDSEKNDEKRQKGGWSHFAVRKIVYGETFWQTASIPVRVFFDGRDDDPKYFDGKLNPFLLFFALLALIPSGSIHQRIHIDIKILSGFSVFFLLFVFFQIDMRIRWISPIVPPMIILSMFGLKRLQRLGSTSKIKKMVVAGVVSIAVAGMMLLNAKYIIALYVKVDPIPYISGQMARDSYILKFRPEYEVIRYANQHLPEDALILCMFIGNRRYYFDKPILTDLNALKRAVITSGSIDQIGARLNKTGITHILVRYDLFNYWTENELNPEKQTLINTFMSNRVKQIKSYGGYGLYKLL
jgi:4-amino-4-deoxy-L-arabinose transferase-like glycosyltransferase